jgi:hypothetical protein
MNKYFLVTISGLALGCGQASAQFYSSETEPLQPRIEAGAKVGTERSIGSMEGWMPLAQDNGSVLYADIRWTADDGDNREGNLGLGYRKIVSDKLAGGDAIIGGHGWMDRRRTDRGSTFHQITAGAEYLKEDWDVKANAYMPLNKDKEYFTPNIGSSTPYLAGTGIFVDTAGYIVEEAQPGGDVEVGYRLPVFESKLDAVRIYGGGYAFIGDQTDDVIGGRVRASVDVNPLVNVGARFQYDEPRGSQGFLEATLRFPFSAKKRFQTNRLRARLDESPERDIDIVTGAKVDNGLRKEVVNTASGQTQRVIHVDNTAATGGDGSKENPFNTLAAAQAAMLDNDVIYVHRGDGTATGMNQGIVINKNNVQLIGSGTDFVYDTNRFTVNRSGPNGTTGSVIVAAGTAPVISNVQARVDNYTGNGIMVLADNAVVAGFNVSNTQGMGISVIATSNWNSVALLNNTVMNSQWYGMMVNAAAGGMINNVIVDSNTSSFSANRAGLTVSAENGGQLGSVSVTNNTANNNSWYGLYTVAQTTGKINSLTLDNNSASSNSWNGIQNLATTNGQIDQIYLANNTSLNNIQQGLAAIVNNNGRIKNLSMHNNLAQGNTLTGITVQAGDGTTHGQIDLATITNNRSINNLQNGIRILSQTTGSVAASLSGNTATGSGASYYGVLIDNDSTGIFSVDLGGGAHGSTGDNRIYGNVNRDVYVDSRPGTAAATPGATISAQNNWWGVGTGLNQGARATFDNGSASPGSSIDGSGYLTSDPGI